MLDKILVTYEKKCYFLTMSLTSTHYCGILLNMSKRSAHFNLISPSLKTASMRFLSTDLVSSQQSAVSSQQSAVSSQQSAVSSQIIHIF